ncbi:MAG: ribosome small subunit-dependent GTPase A [Ignavibacteria bacterium]
MIDLLPLEKLGLNKEYVEKIDPEKLYGFQLGRVISINKNSCKISNGKREIFSELSGKFLFNAETPLDFPAVGDWVYIELFNDESLAVIHEILPRKSLLKRKSAGKKIDYQLIAANIDTAMIMQSADSNYNLRRLERYLSMINESNMHPVVLLSKSDLAEPGDLEKMIAGIHEIMPDIEVIPFSNNSSSDLEMLPKVFTPEKTFCLIGSSGVGKTTLINNLLQEEKFKTQAIREKDGRGKHTTSRRELIILRNGAIIIDNPGMRELGLISIESGITETFNEFTELSSECRFNDCTHTVEEGCAILDALEKGLVSKERYRNYRKMQKESLFNAMSYIEKRQRDKKFGKYIRSVLKHKRDKR